MDTKQTARTLDALVVKTIAWDTFATLPAATRLRNITKRGDIWKFEAWDVHSKTWTMCQTKNDLEKALGIK